jgi:hypothetical protein
VWTPKRIVLLTVGFVLFLALYLVYAHFLGGVDGLKPLPADLEPIATANRDNNLPELPPENDAIRKLRMAFGNDCPEILPGTSQLDLGTRGMVLAVQDFKTRPDGKVQLTPFSLAIFKDHGDGKYPEIYTIRSEEAVLEFDKPVRNIADMSNRDRKLVAADLEGKILIINNRGTANPNDDLSMFTHGPLHYAQSLNRIWTDKVVRVEDLQSKPQPTTVTGEHMDVQLTDDSKPEANPGAPSRRRSEGPHGVDWVRLNSNVEMNLWTEGGFGLGSSSKPPAKKPAEVQGPATAQATPAAKDDPAKKSKVIVRTQGPFFYDLRTNHATFDRLQNQRANYVTVDRVNELEGKQDALACEHLDLQFRRRQASTPPAAGQSGADSMDIETAQATGKEVVLASDAECLEAHGNDFFYDKRTGESILKGSPSMWALKEGNEIHAAELHFLDVNGQKQATVLGEGYIVTFDKVKATRPLEAHWKKKLIYGKDGKLDLLTLIGDASFEDKTNHQQMDADIIKVWMQDSEPAGPPINDQQRRKPDHLEAIGHVRSRSAELTVHDTERLEAYFHDAPLTGGLLPPTASAAGDNKLQATEAAPAVDEKDPRLPPLGAAAPPSPPGEAAKPKKPIDLTARLVRIHAVRYGSKTDLEKLWCEGGVHVHQEASGEDDKGVDIQGGTLELTHHVEGNVLVVTRDPVAGKEAHVQIDRLFILGPEVTIDQTSNEVWVNGAGEMRMPSKSNFDGTNLAHETEMTVGWENRMYFDGQKAVFVGAIQATQNNGRVLCDEMQVVLDRKVSLREGKRDNHQSAKVQKLLCERNVWIEDSNYQAPPAGTPAGAAPRGRLTSNSQIQCPVLYVDNDTETGDSKVDAGGLGRVRLFQLGSKGDLFSSPLDTAPKPPAAAGNPAGAGAAGQGASEEEYKLTYVSYEGKMTANNHRGIATFYYKVVAIHVPTDDRALPIDETKPPAGSIRLSCQDKLEVRSSKLPNGTTNKEMTAYTKVQIIGPNFTGNADIVKYDESKDQVILEGTDARPAMLDKQETKGGPRKQIYGQSILYSPKTGEFKGEKITEVFIK